MSSLKHEGIDKRFIVASLEIKAAATFKNT